MSDTPRVDEKSAGLHGNYAACYGVMEEFARSLERELQTFKNVVDAQQEVMRQKIMSPVMTIGDQTESVVYQAAEAAITDVIRERGRQDTKWGEQNHDAGTWALVLLEEIGEWAKAELHAKFGGPEADNRHTEAVHMTAVALAVIECMNRRQNEFIKKEDQGADEN